VPHNEDVFVISDVLLDFTECSSAVSLKDDRQILLECLPHMSEVLHRRDGLIGRLEVDERPAGIKPDLNVQSLDKRLILQPRL